MGRIKKIITHCIVFTVILSWLFTGQPSFWWFGGLTPKIGEVKAAVPSGVIVAWPSTNGSIPSGWSRVTSLDTYYLEGTTANPSATPGGSSTHTHTSPSHTHTAGHAHTIPALAASTNTATTGTSSGAARSNHTHASVASNASSGSNNGVAVSLDTSSNDPPYTTVIWIQSDGTTDIPDGAWAFYNSDTLPTNWTRQSGNRFLKGAAAGGDGGTTGGSSDSHTHTDNGGAGHTHTEAAHTHTGTWPLSASTTATGTSTSGTLAVNQHTHAATGSSVVATEGAATASPANADAQPPFYKLNIIQNGTGSASLPADTIAMWSGTIASIPANWVLCDGNSGCPNLNDKFIKGANADSEIGTTGGALTHSHGAGATHTHTINNHQHTWTDSTQTTGNRTAASGTRTGSTSGHSHADVLNVTSGGTTGTATITADANSDNRPPYKEIVFIQYQPPAGSLSVDIVDGSGNSVASPSMGMSAGTVSFTYQTTTGSFGTASEKVRVTNTTGSPQWTLSVAASAPTAVWDSVGTDYDFNDPTASAGDGGDADTVGGQMTVNPAASTITPQSGCNTTGLTKGPSAAFSEGVADSITLVTAGATAGTGCYWDITGISISQTIPKEQPAASDYDINMTISVVAS